MALYSLYLGGSVVSYTPAGFGAEPWLKTTFGVFTA